MPEPSANSNSGAAARAAAPIAAPIADPIAGPTEFDAFMAAAVDAIVVIEASGEIVAFSRSAEKMFGYAAAEVMELVVSGLANKVIAMDLGVSQRTVELHRARVMQKVGVRSLAELVRLAESLK